MPVLHVSLHGLTPQAEYELTWQSAAKTELRLGRSPDGPLSHPPDERPSSALILYRKAG